MLSFQESCGLSLHDSLEQLPGRLCYTGQCGDYLHAAMQTAEPSTVSVRQTSLLERVADMLMVPVVSDVGLLNVCICRSAVAFRRHSGAAQAHNEPCNNTWSLMPRRPPMLTTRE